MDNQKQCVSVRLSTSDIRKIKYIAGRLSVSDSDIIRFGIKGMLSKLRPLSYENSTGNQLLPVFLEHSNDLTRHFDFDAERLEQIINKGAGADQCIDIADIELLAMHTVFPNYMKTQLEKLLDRSIKEEELMPRLREYMYTKYGRQHSQQRSEAELV